VICSNDPSPIQGQSYLDSPIATTAAIVVNSRSEGLTSVGEWCNSQVFGVGATAGVAVMVLLVDEDEGCRGESGGFTIW
jgi:hypothetical protein